MPWDHTHPLRRAWSVDEDYLIKSNKSSFERDWLLFSTGLTLLNYIIIVLCQFTAI